jgi:hypothetical protein
LESVANAHTAADLHVRPVSKTALVSRSWAPRAIKKYTMRDFGQLAFMNAASDSSPLWHGCNCSFGKQQVETPRRILRVTILIATEKKLHKIFT